MAAMHHNTANRLCWARGIGIWLWGAVWLWVVSAAVADDAPPAAETTNPPAVKPQSASADAETIAALAKQLDDDDFGRREEATSRLQAIGARAIPALDEAARSKSLEASTRALSILKQFLGSGDAALKARARTTLERLGSEQQSAEESGKNHIAAAAARARAILGDAVQPEQAAVAGGVFPRRRPWPREIPPQFDILPDAPVPVIGHGVSKRVSIRMVNGTLQIEVDETEAGQLKQRAKIVADPQAGIKIDVTTLKDGKEQTETYSAKDVDTLRKERPELHKIYERYGGPQIGGANVKMHFGAGNGPRPAGPGLPLPLEKMAEQLEALSRQAIGGEELRRREEVVRKMKELSDALRVNPPKPHPDDAFEKLKKFMEAEHARDNANQPQPPAKAPEPAPPPSDPFE